MKLLEFDISSPVTAGLDPLEALLCAVRRSIDVHLDGVRQTLPGGPSLAGLSSGKMLRTRLVGYLARHEVPGFRWEAAVAACVATELAHSASLCHDDIIDEAELRRGVPTIWRRMGTPGAILVGDLLIFEAFAAAARSGQANAAAELSRTLVAVCRAEMHQELGHRGEAGDLARWHSVCEGKTGALFGYPARIACGDDRPIAAALHHAALQLGTAYQMYDDYLDVFGDEEVVGKTLGSDARRDKRTIPGAPIERQRVATDAIEARLLEAQACVEPWPTAHAAVSAYLQYELRPCLAGALPSVGAQEV